MNKIAAYFILALCMYSCTKEVVPIPYTYTKVFTGENQKTWKVSFLEETLNGEVIDRFNLGCATDDTYTFKNDIDHTFEIVTGTKKCNSDPEPATIKDTWSFTNASATMTLILPFLDPESRLPFIVRKVNNDDLELEIFFDSNNGSFRIHFLASDEQ